jgi:molybdate/tungstate transport system substrate-binding protein
MLTPVRWRWIRRKRMTWMFEINPAKLATVLLIATAVSAWAVDTVNVLYAGSLVNLMERSVGPAFDQKSGDRFQGYAGGSNKVANEIKGLLRRGDVFVSANPKVNDQLMGQTNGNWVQWYVTFAESPLTIGYNPASRFANDLKNKPWYEALAEPGLKLGRTDPKLDPKGALTVELFKRAEALYHKPDLSQKILGEPENPAQVLPEEALIGRLQSGQLDVGFFYSTETSDAKIPSISLPEEIALKARYTVTILRDAPNPSGAEKFVNFLLGADGRDLLTQHGLAIVKPNLSGDANAVPAAIKSLIDGAQ